MTAPGRAHPPCTIRQDFQRQYGAVPAVSRAPGRVNLIGEHTDYNGGYVMPAALAYATWAAAAPRRDRRFRVASSQFPGEAAFDLDHPPGRSGQWSDYAIGVAIMLERAGYRLRGADMLIDSTVPLGSGLSSSAALEVAVGHALLHAAGQMIGLADLARICQRAENEFVGMRCGIMDQYISCCGIAGAALLIDCRSLDSRPVRVPDSAVIVVIDSKVRHRHAGGEYNLRRQACEDGVRLLKRALPQISQLRDVSLAQLETHRALLPETIFRRCRHVVSEDERVLAGAQALDGGDAKAFGRLMHQSHVSMRDDFAITCPEIDLLVEIAMTQPGNLGARMTGGGFGGCVVALVEAEQAESFLANATAAYQARTGISPFAFACHPGPGVTLVQDP